MKASRASEGAAIRERLEFDLASIRSVTFNFPRDKAAEYEVTVTDALAGLDDLTSGYAALQDEVARVEAERDEARRESAKFEETMVALNDECEALESECQALESARAQERSMTEQLRAALERQSALVSAVERSNRHGNLGMDLEEAWDEYETARSVAVDAFTTDAPRPSPDSELESCRAVIEQLRAALRKIARPDRAPIAASAEALRKVAARALVVGVDGPGEPGETHGKSGLGGEQCSP